MLLSSQIIKFGILIRIFGSSNNNVRMQSVSGVLICSFRFEVPVLSKRDDIMGKVQYRVHSDRGSIVLWIMIFPEESCQVFSFPSTIWITRQPPSLFCSGESRNRTNEDAVWNPSGKSQSSSLTATSLHFVLVLSGLRGRCVSRANGRFVACRGQLH